ncbi:TetR/AcrR family transcriptional regulator [Chryseobacterium sp. RP-3-3]|uniref:TetR/AcrR family transcriptional regulator n=1 Tax=Chryseobacterium antibioticum TaxID=2728847 RepID=A0A7Y0AKV2_9FLAO|nr:TetR/AcrR family transcriptional regulator [Chryseobacterium antibioticum]NML69198.1 TetR/AcrR family transcriptional regulator [Chryseobacterium antibioticum]
MPRSKEFDYTEKLEVVRNLFWEKGYHATSIHDIVASMKLNRSSIYDTYGNKHDLFLKCLSNYAAFKENQYSKASLVKDKGIESLEYIIRDVVHQTLADNKACLIVKTIFEVAPSDPEVKQFILKNAAVLQTILEHSISQARSEGDIKSESSSSVIARYILSSFSSFWSHYILTQNKKEVTEMVDFLMEQIRK